MNLVRSTTITPIARDLLYRSFLRRALLLIWLALVCLSLSPSAQATGPYNTATGVGALNSNTTGSFNTADGYDALHDNTSGSWNTATGAGALDQNISGTLNTADGEGALGQNTTGIGNTAIGFDTLPRNTTGDNNVAIGNSALQLVTTGSRNVAIGAQAGPFPAGDNNIFIGFQVGGTEGDSNTIRIGNRQNATFIAGISGTTVPSGVTVVVGTDGHLGTVVSSRQFKDAIEPMNKVSEAIFSLKPVTFRYKPDLDPDGIPQFGLVAEEVAKVTPDLVGRDENGRPFTVRYEAVNAMLLNEFLKAHHKIEDQEKRIDALETQLEEQKALIHKVSDQLELQKPSGATIATNR
jgi:hypothetical protein